MVITNHHHGARIAQIWGGVNANIQNLVLFFLSNL